ncbi:MAG: sulfite exporter TauE/SafE family protein, partial [Verrucomicrobia bacterium]|nr:sulfite exporter TauE/SafE family protein [Verrucomicrobiota bacterium]
VLPLLLSADCLSVFSFHEHGSWKVLRSLLPATLVGIVTGWWIMPRIPADFFAHTLGWIILGMIGLILLQRTRPHLLGWITGHPLLGLGCGWAAGVTTMIANAAGPITAFYFLSQRFGRHRRLVLPHRQCRQTSLQLATGPAQRPDPAPRSSSFSRRSAGILDWPILPEKSLPNAV